MITFAFNVNENGKWQEIQHAVFPMKNANLLDEQLDEVEVLIKSINRATFKPNTLCRIYIEVQDGIKYATNTGITADNPRVNLYWRAHYKDGAIDYYTLTETLSEYFVVANDKAQEYPIGSGRYNHELYLIESTKIMEGYIGDTLTFTNPLGNIYVEENS